MHAACCLILALRLTRRLLRAAFCTDNVCPGSLVQDCGFSQTVGVLNAANLRYAGKVEVWLENAAHSLLVGFYDVGAHASQRASRSAHADVASCCR